MKNNQYLSVVVELENADTDLTAFSSKINEEYENTNIS